MEARFGAVKINGSSRFCGTIRMWLIVGNGKRNVLL